jgi:CRP-like cAMP-binding protein
MIKKRNETSKIGRRPLIVAQLLLSTLPEDCYGRLRPSLDPVTLSLAEVIYEPHERLAYVHFPTTAVVSVFYTMQDGSTAEMGLVGNDGVLGIALFLGGDTGPRRAVVQIAGQAYKMPAAVLLEEFARGGPFQKMLLRYTWALITQISQTAVCNRLHSVEQRLCRWILLMQDRTNSDELWLTQEFISSMLGDRRESITIAAGRLQTAGVIHYVRGHIQVLDRKGLEAHACECYRTVKAELDRMFGAGRSVGYHA